MVCSALPFEGTTIGQIKARVLEGRFRIPYFLSSGTFPLVCGSAVFFFLGVTTKKTRFCFLCWHSVFAIVICRYDVSAHGSKLLF